MGVILFAMLSASLPFSIDELRQNTLEIIIPAKITDGLLLLLIFFFFFFFFFFFLLCLVCFVLFCFVISFAKILSPLLGALEVIQGFLNPDMRYRRTTSDLLASKWFDSEREKERDRDKVLGRKASQSIEKLPSPSNSSQAPSPCPSPCASTLSSFSSGSTCLSSSCLTGSPTPPPSPSGNSLLSPSSPPPTTMVPFPFLFLFPHITQISNFFFSFSFFCLFPPSPAPSSP